MNSLSRFLSMLGFVAAFNIAVDVLGECQPISNESWALVVVTLVGIGFNYTQQD